MYKTYRSTPSLITVEFEVKLWGYAVVLYLVSTTRNISKGSMPSLNVKRNSRRKEQGTFFRCFTISDKPSKLPFERNTHEERKMVGNVWM